MQTPVHTTSPAEVKIWEANSVKQLLEVPASLLRQEPWAPWLEARGGLDGVLAYLRQLPLAHDEGRLLSAMIEDRRAAAQEYCKALNISRSTYFRLRGELFEALASHLNSWSLPLPAPAPAAQAAPDVPEPAPRINLPQQQTRLIGRQREVDEIKRLLLKPAVRLVTLTGPGGIGKTRLSLQVARELGSIFPDGICFVPLAPLRDPELLVSTLAHALGLQELAGLAPFELLANYLGGKRLLLVLDNFEQIVDAGTALGELLEVAPQVKLLVTSRELLRVYGEQAYAVPPLTLPAAAGSAGGMTDSEAVWLFVERAQAARAEFTLDDAARGVVVEICRRLDGLPLAIELAAARVRLFTPWQILERLAKRFDLLVGGARNLPARQQTLRGAIDWSYELLEPEERLLFRRLAVFVEGCSLAAIEAVCGAVELPLPAIDDLLRALEGLLDQSLLLQWDGPGDEEPRFVMLETIQEYALEQLARSEEMRLLQQRHAGYYLALAQRAAPELDGSGQQCWLEQLEREHGNMRAALQWAIGQADADLALRLSGALWKFWRFYGHHREGRRWLEQVLALPGSRDLALRARVLHAAGWIVYDQGDAAQAGAWYAESLALAEQLGDRRGVGLALQGIGEIAQIKGDYAEAQRSFEQSLALFRELGDLEETAWSLDHLGQSLLYQGDLTRAEQLHQEALALFRQLAHSWGIAIALMHLGETLFYQGELDRALALMEECLERSRELGDIRNPLYAFSLTLLGELRFYQGEGALARDLLAEGLALSSEGGFLWCVSQACGALALLEREAGALGAAAEHVRRGLEIQQHLRQLRRVVLLLEDAAGVMAACGDDAGAAELYGAAATLRGRSGPPLPAPELPRYEREIAALRQRLAAPPLAAAWDGGARLDLDQAIARALALLDGRG